MVSVYARAEKELRGGDETSGAGWCVPCGVARCIAWCLTWCIGAWCIAWCIGAWCFGVRCNGAWAGACVTRLRRDEREQVGAVKVVGRVTAPAGLVAPAVQAAVVSYAHVHRVVEAHLKGCRGGASNCRGVAREIGEGCMGCKGV